MKLIKKLVMYICVALIVGLICFTFSKTFAFKSDDNSAIPEIDTNLITKLYTYLPSKEIGDTQTLYNTYYLTINNISYITQALMTYNYIINYDEFKLKTVPEEEKNNLNIEGTILYKITKEDFINTLTYLFGTNERYYDTDFKINSNLKAKFKNDTYYIYEENTIDNIIYYKGLDSYTLTDNRETIKLNEYYLRCNKETKECFDKEGSDTPVSYIKYSENLDINSIKDKIKRYEHVFKYESDHYIWISTEGI